MFTQSKHSTDTASTQMQHTSPNHYCTHNNITSLSFFLVTTAYTPTTTQKPLFDARHDQKTFNPHYRRNTEQQLSFHFTPSPGDNRYFSLPHRPKLMLFHFTPSQEIHPLSLSIGHNKTNCTQYNSLTLPTHSHP